MAHQTNSICPLRLKKATNTDISKIITIYHKGFENLYRRYHDDETNPYKESPDLIYSKMQISGSCYHFIIYNNRIIGLIRTIINRQRTVAEISPLVILPAFQNNKFAQKTLKKIELLHPTVKIWRVNTIKQEPKLIHLYLKCGYQLIQNKIQPIKQGMDIVFFEKRIGSL